MEATELGPSLLAAFARVPDVRSHHGRRYPVPALLTLATAAMLCGARSLYAMAQWGRLQPDTVRRALGFRGPQMPGITTLHYVFKRLAVAAFEAELQTWAVQALDADTQQLVLDGKALRGIHGEELPGVRLVALYAAEAGLGDRRKRGVRTKEEQAQTAEDREQAKQEAELSVAPRLLEQVRPRLEGRLVSGDALYCQKSLCRQLRAAGAHFLFAVKDHQPSLHDDIRLLFHKPPPGEVFLTAQTVDKHGGRLERRHLRASATLGTYLREAGWPDVGLVLEVEAWVTWPCHPTRPQRHEIRYFVSSLPAATPPADALRRVRLHWQIENRLHWPRDVTLGEDACQVRSGPAPQALAAVRNAVLGLLHGHHIPNAAAFIRTCGWSPPATLFTLLGLAPPEL
jgi:predicted transposase YbfD/YdcC